MATKTELEARIAELEAAQAIAETLNEISRGVNTVHNEDELLHVLARPAMEHEIVSANLMYVDLDRAGELEWLEVVATWHWKNSPAMTVGQRLPMTRFPMCHLFMANPDEPLLIADVAVDERVDKNAGNMLLQAGSRAVVVLPLTQAERWVGLITFAWGEPHKCDAHEEALYRGLIDLVAPAVENRRLLAQTQKALTDVAIFETMAENSLDAIVMADIEAKLLYANRAAHQMFGCDYETREMVGKSGAIYWPEEDLPILADTVMPQALAGGWSGEVRQKRQDGTIFDASASIFPLLDNGGQPIGIVVTIRDITAQKEAEAERERLQQEVIEAQQQAIKELSTPVIPIMDHIIVMPLIGSIDTVRARDITRALLAGIREHRAKVVIMDITGVPIVDSGVADHLNKSIQAARLKGARAIVTGISDAVAETIVDLGIDWGSIQTLSDTQSGLLTALGSLGFTLARQPR